ncbi:MAG: hypothetical protein R3C71_13375 [Candidatus Krumholzibacteriia bacterium]
MSTNAASPARRILRVLGAALAAPRTGAILWALAILLHLAVFWIVRENPLQSDALSYQLTAERLRSLAHYDPYWPPGLPLYLVGWSALFGALGSSIAVARASMLPVFFLLAWLLYRALLRTAGRPAANLALLAVTLQPMFLLYSVTPFTQLPVGLLLAAALWVFVQATERSTLARTLVLALALALLPLFRASALLLAALLPALLWRRSRRWRDLAVPALAVGVALGLWLVKAHDLAGRFVPVNSANVRNVYVGNNPWTPLYRTWWFSNHRTEDAGVPAGFIAARDSIDALPDGERDAALRRGALDHVARRPDLFALRSINRVRAFFALDILTASYARRYHGLDSPLVYAGIVGLDGLVFLGATALAWLVLLAPSLPPFQRRLIRYAWICGGLYALPYFLAFSHPTYHFPLIPLFLLGALAALGGTVDDALALLASPFRAGRGRRLAAVGGLALLVAIQVEWVLINALAG